MCVCLSVYLYCRTTGNEAVCEWYPPLQCNKLSNSNVADLAKTAAFWQEKLSPLWTTFHDPTHQLARCACVFITRLGACSTGCPWTCLEQLRLESCVVVNATSGAASLFQNCCIHSSVCIYCMAPVAIVVLASSSPAQLQSHTQIVFAPKVGTSVLFISEGSI